MTKFLKNNDFVSFRDEKHRDQFHEILSKMESHDCYHLAVAYLMALADMPINDIFDFDMDCIKPEGLNASWQTSSSECATRLLFNLWNSYVYNNCDDQRESIISRDYSVCEIFKNQQYAPFFYEAIRLRFDIF